MPIELNKSMKVRNGDEWVPVPGVVVGGDGGKFELIEEITLSGEVSRIDRNSTPEGKPYKFKSLIIVVETPANVAVYGCQIYVNGYPIARFGISGSNQYVQHSVSNIEIVNGRCFSFGSGTSLNNITNVINTSGLSPYGFIGEPMDTINNLVISSYSGAIRSGAKVKIYGVWA